MSNIDQQRSFVCATLHSVTVRHRQRFSGNAPDSVTGSVMPSAQKSTAIEPSHTGKDLRTFTYPHRRRVERHIIESAVTLHGS
jgi:hypothetical protein